jgi:hypothetical protein
MLKYYTSSKVGLVFNTIMQSDRIHLRLLPSLKGGWIVHICCYKISDAKYEIRVTSPIKFSYLQHTK